MCNIFTVDLEEWFHANYNGTLFDVGMNYEVRVVQNALKILNHFSKYNTKATFFVLGYVAEKHPDLVREIHARGHEIASHGYAHELVYNQTKEDFKYDLQKSIEIIENVTNCKVKGYRAPSWSITEKSLWAWEALEEVGLTYDASVFPIKTFLYGMPSAPRFRFMPLYNNRQLKIFEIPMSTIRIFNRNIPFSGGMYFRVLPYSIIRYGIKQLNKDNNPAIVYLHPREIDPEQPRMKLSFTESLIHYTGLKACENKLVRLLEEFKFTSIEEYYKL